MATRRPTGYVGNFGIKPFEVSATGEVMFTDGTDTRINPDQISCEAYGYTFDQTTGTCKAYTITPRLTTEFDNITNVKRGRQNSTQMGTENSVIVGNSNTTKGFNNNTLIVGNGHEIENGFNNSSILGGNLSKITRQSEVAIGGGKASLSDSTDAATFSSRRQTSTIELSGVTIDNTATNLTVQGDGSSYINVKANSIIGYDIYITRLELAGSSGTAGNYSYRNIRGAVKIDNSLTMSFVVGFSRNIAKIGQNGTCIMADSTTGGVASISVNVQDRNNVHNLWSASVTLHEVISETTF
jgi:hypothetical protein